MLKDIASVNRVTEKVGGSEKPSESTARMLVLAEQLNQMGGKIPALNAGPLPYSPYVVSYRV